MTLLARIVTLALVSVTVEARPQAPPAAGASIGGRVLASDTGLPLAGATVRLAGPSVARAVPADPDGYFEFGGIPPGRYLLTAVTKGYAIGAAGQSSPSDVPRSLELARGETRTQADIHLMPLGKISGRITDDTGAPVAAVGVQAVRRPRSLTDERAASFSGGVTGADGTFAIAGLPAGHYYVIGAVRPSPTSPPSGGLPPALFRLASMTYYPGTGLPAGAQTVRVELGLETPGVSFVMQPTRLARIEGVVVDSRGQPASDAVVTLGNSTADVPMSVFLGTFREVASDGRFSLVDVPPGVYSLDVRSRSVYEAIARTGGATIEQIRASPEFATVPVFVTGEDIDNLTVRTDRGFTLSGRIVVEGPMPPLQSVRVSATHVGDAAQQSRWAMSGVASVQPDGAFEIPKLLGAQIVRVSGLPAGWGVKRVRIGATDVTDDAIDVSLDVAGVDVVVARLSETSGVVTDRRGVPIPGATVVVFPENRQQWTVPFTRFVKATLSSSSGAYTIAGLPAGRYYAAVVPAVLEGTAADPDDLEPLVPGAARLTLGDGERRTLNLRLE
jgi:Carboxypeptidase regulatory-like domain